VSPRDEGPFRAVYEHPGSRRFAVGGEFWLVYEVLAPPPNGPALVFMTDKVARRVRSYPANWRELRDDELYALSWSR
jgi:hypothetical protein